MWSAEKERLGKKFKHINGSIFTVIELENKKYFENENLDLFTVLEKEWMEEIK